jgi:pimeloyl-ACP methyl ester carboxylesterase
MVAEMFTVRHPDKVAGLVLLDPTESTTPRFLTDTTASRILVAIELTLNLLVLNIIGFAALLRLQRTRVGRAVVRRSAAKHLSQEKLDRIYEYADDHPRALLETARFGRRTIPYLRETKAALNSSPLPDVPMRIVAPQPRPVGSLSWPKLMQPIALSLRGSREENSSPPTGPPTNGCPTNGPT